MEKDKRDWRNFMSTKEKLLAFMEEKAYKPLVNKELAEIFDIDKEQRKSFYKILDEMEKEGLVIKTREDTYGIPEKMNLIVGKLQGNPKGFGFLLPEDKDCSDVFISPNDLNGALHGDKVIVRLNKKSNIDRKPEGEVIRILERANEKIVGTFEKNKNFGFVIPDDQRISMDVFVPKSEINSAKTNQKVVVEITRWPEKRRNPEGKIVEVLGYIDEAGTDVLSIVRKYNLSEEFPEKVLNEAENIPEKVNDEDLIGRLDLRDKTIFTIDGADAKDLDDAISVEKLDNGNYMLGVHIADVTNYVKENSPLDKEALSRGTSVYLVDRVIPMLPKRLSNGICSLNPNTPRLTLSVFMEIDKKGKIIDHRVAESVIESKERLVYTDISDILEKDDENLKERYAHIMKDIEVMAELYNVLKKKREDRGSIDFDFDEAYIVLDEEGKPVNIKKAERRIANGIIEEFMLACNETVAEYMYWSQIPFVYRIHEDPDEAKINEFNKFIYNFGYTIKGLQNVHPKDLQILIKKIKGKKEETVINTIMLRSLKKARYSVENEGHFGLATDNYCHFTSPIRRYPDLQIHRIIKKFINNRMSTKKIEKLRKILPEVADQCSQRERLADEAERETDELKMVEYMSKRLGEEYEGIISGVTSFGMFVELDNTIEGLVHISTLTDDYYTFDEENYSLIGDMTKKTYRIGDLVKIRVANTNINKREIDFILV